METQWITLFSDTFIWTKKNEGIIYNSKKSQGFHFNINDRIAKICQELLLPANLYTTVLTSHDLENSYVRKWIHSITNNYAAGYLTPAIEKRPVSYIPILKILDDAEYYIWEHQRGFGGKILQNIHELTFYINNSDTGNNTHLKQAIFPLRNCPELEINKIVSFIRHSQNPFLSNINLVGNIFTYTNYKQLIHHISDWENTCTVKITIQDFNNHILELQKIQWPNNIRFNVLIDSIPVILWKELHSINISASVTGFISSENEYNLFSEQFKDIPVYSDAQIIPIYNGNNLQFFKDNVFLASEDFNEMTLKKQDILMHQVLNTNDFGKLTILPDGTVYANLSMEPLGTVEDTVYSLVYKEFTEGKSWFHTRKQVPCTDCVYQWLCPSPGNYELAIGKANLCHVKP